DRWVKVSPGVAIDCCGRELVLEQVTSVEVWTPPETGGGGDRSAAPPRRYPLYVRCCGQPTEGGPALCHEGARGPAHQDADRRREVAELEAHLWDAAHDAGCWRPPDHHPGKERQPPRHDCTGEPCMESAGCLKPDCPCRLGVPLALITPTPGQIIGK